jgi:hypothetical protein
MSKRTRQSETSWELTLNQLKYCVDNCASREDFVEFFEKTICSVVIENPQLLDRANRFIENDVPRFQRERKKKKLTLEKEEVNFLFFIGFRCSDSCRKCLLTKKKKKRKKKRKILTLFPWINYTIRLIPIMMMMNN